MANAPGSEKPFNDDPIEDVDTVPATISAFESVPKESAQLADAGPREVPTLGAVEGECDAVHGSGLDQNHHNQHSVSSGGTAEPVSDATAAPPPAEPEPDAGFKQYLKAVHASMAKHAAKGGMSAIAEVTKRASLAWEGLTDLERAPWEAKALSAGVEAKEPLRPAGQQVLFSKNQDDALSGKKTKPEKKIKDPNAPKRPVGGAFGIFSSERRSEFQEAARAKGEKGIGAVAKLASEAWKTLSEQDKQEYESRFAKAMEEYKAAAVAYSENKLPEDAQCIGGDSGVKRTASSHASEKPKKEARTVPEPSAAAAAAAKRALFGLPAQG